MEFFLSHRIEKDSNWDLSWTSFGQIPKINLQTFDEVLCFVTNLHMTSVLICIDENIMVRVFFNHFNNAEHRFSSLTVAHNIPKVVRWRYYDFLMINRFQIPISLSCKFLKTLINQDLLGHFEPLWGGTLMHFLIVFKQMDVSKNLRMRKISAGWLSSVRRRVAYRDFAKQKNGLALTC